jgi:hypothetical protein
VKRALAGVLALLASLASAPQASAYSLTKINSTGLVHLLTDPPTPQIIVKATPVLGIDADENLVVMKLNPDGTASLPTGAATSAKQDEQTAILQEISDKVATEVTQQAVLAAVDGIEALITGTNTRLDTANDWLDSIFTDMATAANQATQIALATSTNTKLDTVNANLVTIQGKQDAQTTQLTAINANTDTVESLLATSNTNTGNTATSTASIDTKLSTTNSTLASILAFSGQTSTFSGQTSTNTGALNTAFGAQADSAASSDTGTFSFIALFKRHLQGLTTLLAQTDTLETRTGDLTETAPGTDTASSGLNGRLQRIAQRLSTILGSFFTTNPAPNDSALAVRPLPFTPQTFTIHARNITIGNLKSMISLLNAGGSTVIVRVHKIKIFSVQTAAVTGVMANFGLRKISTHSAGTQLNTTGSASGLIYPSDSTNSLNASVTARTGASVTESIAFNIDNWLWSSDEFGTGTADAETTEHTSAQLVSAWEAKDGTQPYVLRAGEGLHVIQSTNSANGTFDLFMLITQEGS